MSAVPRQREVWTQERTEAECALRDHPEYGDPNPGAPYVPGRATGVCLCGAVVYVGGQRRETPPDRY